eukprot:bmy_22234T0
MLLPMGLPKNLSVVAWGLSLEHLTMIKCGINSVWELKCREYRGSEKKESKEKKARKEEVHHYE